MTPNDSHRTRLYNEAVNQLADLNNDYSMLREQAVFDVLRDVLSERERRYEPLTEDEQLELLEASASTEFVIIAARDDGERNSVRENADRVLAGHVDTEGGIPDLAFGDFGTHLWNGDLYRAMKLADKQNTRRLLEAFGLPYVNAQARLDTETPTPERGYKMSDNGRVVYK